MNDFIRKKLLLWLFPIPTQEEPKVPPKKKGVVKVVSADVVDRNGIMTEIELPRETIVEMEKMMENFFMTPMRDMQGIPEPFPMGAMPQPPAPVKKTGTNKNVLEAVEMLLTRYRAVKRIPFDVTLTHTQINDIMEGVRREIYKYEGRPMPKK